MSDGKVAAALDEIRERVGQSAALLTRMPVSPREFNASQDRLAEWTAPLLAALDAVLDLADGWSVDRARTTKAALRRQDAQFVREAISRALLGEDSSDA